MARFLSEFQPRKQIVPPPAQAPRYAGHMSSLLWHPEGWPESAPAGTWLIRNAIVTWENKIGPWSAPATLADQPAGWILFGCDSNLPVTPHRAAVAWQAEQTGTGFTCFMVEGWRGGSGAWDLGLNPVDSLQPYPWSSNNHEPYPLWMHKRGNGGIPPLGSALALPAITTPPAVWSARHHLGNVLVFRSWVTHTGETGPGPVATLDAIDAGKYGMRRLLFSEAPAIGALGYYLYTFRNGYWQRCRTLPWMPATADGCLFAPNNFQPILWDDQPGEIYEGSGPWNDLNNPDPLPENVDAYSIISRRQVAYLDCKDSIIVDVESEEYTPVVDPYDSAAFDRTTSGHGAGPWTYRQVTTIPAELQEAVGLTVPNNHPTYWPANIICNHGTTFIGMRVRTDTSRGPGLSSAVSSADYTGDQAFNFTGSRCQFTPGYGSFPFTTAGLSIRWENAATAIELNGQFLFGHTASEWILDQCEYDGNEPIELRGYQTQNMAFLNSLILGFPPGECSSIIVDGADAYFDGLVAARCGTVFSLTATPNLVARRLFIDRASISLVDQNDFRLAAVLEISGSDTCGLDYTIRSPIALEPTTLNLRGWKKYRPEWDGAVIRQAGRAFTASWKRMTLDVTDSPKVAPYVCICQPAFEDFHWRVPADKVFPPVNVTPSLIIGEN